MDNRRLKHTWFSLWARHVAKLPLKLLIKNSCSFKLRFARRASDCSFANALSPKMTVVGESVEDTEDTDDVFDIVEKHESCKLAKDENFESRRESSSSSGQVTLNLKVSAIGGNNWGGATTTLSGWSVGSVSLVDQTDSIDIVRARSRRRASGRARVFDLGEKKPSNICLMRRFCLPVIFNEWSTSSSSPAANNRENRDIVPVILELCGHRCFRLLVQILWRPAEAEPGKGDWSIYWKAVVQR